MFVFIALGCLTAYAKGITVEGYLADNLCIDQPFKLTPDGANITHAPWRHKKWCLYNRIPVCVESGYGILTDTATPKGWAVAYRIQNSAKVIEQLMTLQDDKDNLNYVLTGTVNGTSTQYASFENDKLVWKTGPAVNVLVVESITAKLNVPTPQPEPTVPTPQPEPEPEPEPGMTLGDVKATYKLSSDKKTSSFTVTLPRTGTWVGFGVNQNKEAKMVGSDVYVCDGTNQPARYLLAGYSLPTKSAADPSLKCESLNGATKMTFDRAVGASTFLEPGKAAFFVAAHGDGQKEVTYHGSTNRKGGGFIFAPEPEPKPTVAPKDTSSSFSTTPVYAVAVLAGIAAVLL
mmetsp:Transcript_43980/g.86025  ORF Transcript_43980/g.86025 Transcript_43980/m.86025 type:complete len:346 (+) Transcript_43980:32-1069(+)